MNSVEAAISEYTHWRFELIILDCDCELVNGASIITLLKSTFPDVPVIFVTAACSAENVRQIYRAGARDFYFKPIDPSDLQQKVNRLLVLRREMQWERRSTLPSSIPVKSTNNGLTTPPELPERLQRVLAHIEKHYDNELYLEHLADKACLSKFHFCRIFKLHLGMTPMKFVSHLRIERARRLIEENVGNMSAVAYRVGFNDVGDFIKQFKKNFGITPSRYKALFREESEGCQ
jgi:YesN/AraC family two-component response regulator